VPSTLAQNPPTQNPESQSQSVEQVFVLHPPTVAVAVHSKLAGQPVWLQGSAWQPWASAPVPPTAHSVPVGQVYPASQGCGAQP
jgi:hypothetical protein